MNERKNEWMHKWMNDWMNEWMNKPKNECKLSMRSKINNFNITKNLWLLFHALLAPKINVNIRNDNYHSSVFSRAPLTKTLALRCGVCGLSGLVGGAGLAIELSWPILIVTNRAPLTYPCAEVQELSQTTDIYKQTNKNYLIFFGFEFEQSLNSR